MSNVWAALAAIEFGVLFVFTAYLLRYFASKSTPWLALVSVFISWCVLARGLGWLGWRLELAAAQPVVCSQRLLYASPRRALPLTHLPAGTLASLAPSSCRLTSLRRTGACM